MALVTSALAALLTAALAPSLTASARPAAQADASPTNNLPNPYRTVANYFKMPDGREWGSTSAVELDKDGRSIWVAERQRRAQHLGRRALRDQLVRRIEPAIDPQVRCV